MVKFAAIRKVSIRGLSKDKAWLKLSTRFSTDTETRMDDPTPDANRLSTTESDSHSVDSETVLPVLAAPHTEYDPKSFPKTEVMKPVEDVTGLFEGLMAEMGESYVKLSDSEPQSTEHVA